MFPNSGSGPLQPNDRCHNCQSSIHPRPMMISSMPPPRGVANPPPCFGQVPNPMIAQPQPQAGGLVAGPSPPQLQQTQGLSQPIPAALQVWIFETIQKEVQRQLSLRIQGGQGGQAAQVAILQRRIVALEQEVKRLGKEKEQGTPLRLANGGGDVDSSRSTRPQ